MDFQKYLHKTIQPYRITVKRKVMEYEFRYGIDNRVIALCRMYNIKIEMHMDSSSLSMSEADYAKLCDIMPKARIILSPKPVPVKPSKPKSTKPLKPIRATSPAKFLARKKMSSKRKDTSSPEKLAREYALLREREGAPECARDLCMSRDDEKTWYSMFLVDWQNSNPALCYTLDWYERNKVLIDRDCEEYKKLYQLFGNCYIHGTTVEEFLAKVKASKKYWWCDSQGVPKWNSSRVEVENEYKKIRHAEGAPPEGNDIRFIELEKNYTLAWFLPEWQNNHPGLCQNIDWYITNKDRIKREYRIWRESKYQQYLYDEKKRDDEFTVVVYAIIGVPIIGFVGYLFWPLIKLIFGYTGFLLSLPFVFLFSMDTAGPQEFAMEFLFSFALFITIVAFLLNLFR